MKRGIILLLVLGVCLSATTLIFYHTVLPRLRRPHQHYDHQTTRNAKVPQHLATVSDTLGAINVYFNKSVISRSSKTGTPANGNINLETRLISRLHKAQKTIDMALYELNLPRITAALLERAAAGITVRVLVDAKKSTDPRYIYRYQIMRIHLEKLARGYDTRVGTADDIILFADSPIFAVTDTALRIKHGLPQTPSDFPVSTVQISHRMITGALLALGEQKKRENRQAYYSPRDQMHNKFALIDSAWVWTGSWNFTVTGLYGSQKNMRKGILGGNTQACVEIHSPALTSIFLHEFEEMWGSATSRPNPTIARFHGRKKDNTPHRAMVGGRLVEVYFSPGDQAVDRIAELIAAEADYNTYFSIFAWSHQGIADILKQKWEHSIVDFEGTRTSFSLGGVFDESFWNQWWSASVDLRGRKASRISTHNPNTRWRYPAPVFPDAEDRKMHAKTMIIDVDTQSDPTVITGSLNWSANGQNSNDENVLFIHDPIIADQFMQEFRARYARAGGILP